MRMRVTEEILHIVEIEDGHIRNDGRQIYTSLGRAEASPTQVIPIEIKFRLYVYIYLPYVLPYRIYLSSISTMFIQYFSINAHA